MDSLAEAAPTNAQMEGQQPSLPAMGFGITDLISSSHLPGEDYNHVNEAQVDGDWGQDVPLSQSNLQEENGDDILPRVCQEIATISTRVQPTTTGSSWGKVLEYHNSLDALGILGEVLAGRDSRNLIAIDRGASHVRRDDELCGLDEHDISYLHKKGVFDLPPREVW